MRLDKAEVFEGAGPRVVDEDNFGDVYDAFDLEDLISFDDVKAIFDSVGSKEVCYGVFADKLIAELLDARKVDFDKVMHQSFSYPVDRITRFTSLLKSEFQA